MSPRNSPRATRRVVLVRHGDDPPDDRVVTHLLKAGYDPDIRRPFRGDLLGDVTDDVAGTVIYGGPYNAYDAALHPFLNEEYRWIDAALKADIPMLGICQGAQMIAYHLGEWAGAPASGLHEFGYYEITPTGADPDFLPGPLHVVESHYHTFDLPKGAVHLARSESYENQAFRLGDKVYGFQFHPEQTIEGFRRWQETKPGTYGMPGVQDRETQTRLMLQHDAAQAEWFYGFLERLFPSLDGRQAPGEGPEQVKNVSN
ncbi:MAG: glutamine amidotransferase [Rhodobacteraceae bacterium]|nr:MAG: glutamine amidotransferase [Paracoccaceae bacterium]